MHSQLEERESAVLHKNPTLTPISDPVRHHPIPVSTPDFGFEVAGPWHA